MAADQAQPYRDHVVWATLERIKSEVEHLSDDQRTSNTENIGAAIDAALKRRRAPGPYIVYADVLDGMGSLLTNYFGTSEVESGNAVSYIPQLSPLVRQLPPPPSRELVESYKLAIEEAAQTAYRRLDDLESSIAQVQKQAGLVETSCDERVQATESAVAKVETRVTTAIDMATRELEGARAEIKSASVEAASTIRAEWLEEFAAWKDQAQQDKLDHDARFRDELGLLVAAAQIGQRLVEHAAGTLTALEWTKRATRERKTGNVMRVLAIITLIVAAATGVWMVAEALREALTIGEGLLRVGVVAAITGLGGYLGAESRRHLHEADSSEEVSTVIQQMEPFLAGSDDRNEVRREISNTVFVRNVLSRFTKRDAHGKQIAEQNIPEVLTALTESVKSLAAVQRGKDG